MEPDIDELLFMCTIVDQYIPAEYAALICWRLRQANEMEKMLKDFKGTMKKFMDRDKEHLIRLNRMANLLEQIIDQN